FLLLFALGAVVCLRRRAGRTAGWLAVHGCLLATLVTALVFWGSPRFRDANAPLLMLYAAVTVGALRGRRHAPALHKVPGAGRPLLPNARCPRPNAGVRVV